MHVFDDHADVHEFRALMHIGIMQCLESVMQHSTLSAVTKNTAWSILNFEWLR